MEPLERTEILYATLSTLDTQARGLKGVAGRLKEVERYNYVMGYSHGMQSAANLIRQNILQKEGDFFRD